MNAPPREENPSHNDSSHARTVGLSRLSAVPVTAGVLTLLPLIVVSSQKIVPAFAMPVAAIALVFAFQAVWPARFARTAAALLVLIFFSLSITSVGLLFVPGLAATIGAAVDAWKFPRVVPSPKVR